MLVDSTSEIELRAFVCWSQMLLDVADKFSLFTLTTAFRLWHSSTSFSRTKPSKTSSVFRFLKDSSFFTSRFSFDSTTLDGLRFSIAWSIWSTWSSTSEGSELRSPFAPSSPQEVKGLNLMNLNLENKVIIINFRIFHCFRILPQHKVPWVNCSHQN